MDSGEYDGCFIAVWSVVPGLTGKGLKRNISGCGRCHFFTSNNHSRFYVWIVSTSWDDNDTSLNFKL